ASSNGNGLFLKDRETGITERLAANGFNAAMSTDGRYVAFVSSSSEIMVLDRQTGATQFPARPASGAASSGASQPSLSDDGQIVAFASSSSNLVAGDVNNTTDVFDSICAQPGTAAPTPTPTV